jgi:hypothetical protein
LDRFKATSIDSSLSSSSSSFFSATKKGLTTPTPFSLECAQLKEIYLFWKQIILQNKSIQEVLLFRHQELKTRKDFIQKQVYKHQQCIDALQRKLRHLEMNLEKFYEDSSPQGHNFSQLPNATETRDEIANLSPKLKKEKQKHKFQSQRFTRLHNQEQYFHRKIPDLQTLCNVEEEEKSLLQKNYQYRIYYNQKLGHLEATYEIEKRKIIQTRHQRLLASLEILLDERDQIEWVEIWKPWELVLESSQREIQSCERFLSERDISIPLIRNNLRLFQKGWENYVNRYIRTRYLQSIINLESLWNELILLCDVNVIPTITSTSSLSNSHSHSFKLGKEDDKENSVHDENRPCWIPETEVYCLES